MPSRHTHDATGTGIAQGLRDHIVGIKPQGIRNRPHVDSGTGVKFRSGVAGAHRNSSHSGSCEIRLEAFGEHRRPRLRRRVGPSCDPSRNTAHREDVPAAPFDHSRKCCPRQSHHRNHHHLEQLLFHIHVIRQEATANPEPGVVDQYVHTMLRNELFDPCEICRDRKIRRDDCCCHTELRFEFSRHGLQSTLVSADQDKVMALPCEFGGECSADSCRWTRHQGDG